MFEMVKIPAHRRNDVRTDKRENREFVARLFGNAERHGTKTERRMDRRDKRRATTHLAGNGGHSTIQPHR